MVVVATMTFKSSRPVFAEHRCRRQCTAASSGWTDDQPAIARPADDCVGGNRRDRPAQFAIPRWPALVSKMQPNEDGRNRRIFFRLRPATFMQPISKGFAPYSPWMFAARVCLIQFD
jgi:hypothetical protein